MRYLLACPTLSHFLNQCWFIGNWTPGKKWSFDKKVHKCAHNKIYLKTRLVCLKLKLYMWNIPMAGGSYVNDPTVGPCFTLQISMGISLLGGNIQTCMCSLQWQQQYLFVDRNKGQGRNTADSGVMSDWVTPRRIKLTSEQRIE